MTVFYRSRYCHYDGSWDKDMVALGRKKTLFSAERVCSLKYFALCLSEISKYKSKISRKNLIEILSRAPYKVDCYVSEFYLDGILKGRESISLAEIEKFDKRNFCGENS